MDKVYLQTYSLGQTFRDDFKGSMEKLKALGYDGVEFAGYYGDMTATELKAYLDEIGMECVSGHVQLNQIEETIPFLKEVGARLIICPMTRFQTKEECLQVAAEFNRLGKLAKEAGLQFGYHNHTDEFAEIDGKYLLEIVMENTDPDLVKFQIDVGWAAAAGINVPEFLTKYQDRLCAIHVKEADRVVGPQKPLDFSKVKHSEDGRPIFPPELLAHLQEMKTLDCPTGKGLTNWKVVRDIANKAGAGIYIIEREWDYKGDDIFGCVKEDIDSLREIFA